jgi:hypothetical protein
VRWHPQGRPWTCVVPTKYVIPDLQRREVGGYSFLFFFLIQVMRFGDLKFVENIHQYNSRMVGRELSCKRVAVDLNLAH